VPADIIDLERKGFFKTVNEGRTFVFVPSEDFAKKLKVG
jgi:hypothetical protein